MNLGSTFFQDYGCLKTGAVSTASVGTIFAAEDSWAAGNRGLHSNESGEWQLLILKGP